MQGAGDYRFLRPDGRDLDAPIEYRMPPQLREIVERNRRDGVEITYDTAATGWRGEKMDYGLAVDGLLHRWRKGKPISAETRHRKLA